MTKNLKLKAKFRKFRDEITTLNVVTNSIKCFNDRPNLSRPMILFLLVAMILISSLTTLNIGLHYVKKYQDKICAKYVKTPDSTNIE